MLVRRNAITPFILGKIQSLVRGYQRLLKAERPIAGACSDPKTGSHLKAKATVARVNSGNGFATT